MLTKRWLVNLKLAIIDENTKEIVNLYQNMPNFKEEDLSKDELLEIQALIAQAVNVVQNECLSLRKAMDGIKKAREYQINSAKHYS